MPPSEFCVADFEKRFGGEPDFLVRAPGRVNLIGEHTDYNDGFVLPVAIDRAVWIALRPRLDRRVAVHSLDFNKKAGFSLYRFRRGRGWIEYVKGVAYGLQAGGFRLEGWEGVMAGDVPRGAGLSSSAAVEMAAARAFASVSGIAWEPARMARVGQVCENRWVGVKSGIMDQMTSAAAKEGHALFLDCRSLEYEHVPLPDGTAVVVLDTSTRRGLVGSEYNERRYQCELAARTLGVKALRDVSWDEFKAKNKKLEGPVLKRARHVVTENQRVLESVAAMRSGDVARLGLLLNASHASLRDDFEVSSEALNLIVEAAQAQDGCYGARMTGAGFGGCAVALVDGSKLGEFVPAVETAYRQRSGLEAAVYVCRASAGATVNVS
ncbi:MAG: galactokinase [Chloroflexota bacterium]